VSSRDGATHESVRQRNLGTLVRILHEDGPSTRSYLSTATGLNRSTVGALVAELADAGLVRETAPVGKGVGRPSIGVAAVDERAFVLAVDLRVDRIITALVGIGGHVMARRSSARGARRPDRVLARLGTQADALLADAPADGVLVGIGVGVPGLVRRADGLVRFAPNLGWADVPLGERVADAVGVDVPVMVGNDSDLGALAEWRRGVARGDGNLGYLSGQVGVGGGVIVDGSLLSGSDGYGGEVGHMRINPGGRSCRCGATGCWETEVGEQAILTTAGRSGGAAEIEQLVADAAAGDRRARAALRTVGRWLGIGVVNLANIFNPQSIVFGGTLRNVFPATADDVAAELAAGLAAPHEHLRLALPALGDDSTLFGAAEAAFEPLLVDPMGVLEGAPGPAQWRRAAP
jgi:predicted NBD/HSP70 family sugar kinase